MDLIKKIGATLLLLIGVCAEGSQVRKLEALDIKKEAAQADWRYFHTMPPDALKQLWNYHSQRGRELKDWSWTWRLGWIQRCAASTEGYCLDLLKKALFDRAMVVRASAATAIGDRFSGTGDQKMLSLLKNAYELPQNKRGGKPLHVQYRILFAIKQIGGAEAAAIGKTLAIDHKQATQYWRAIQ